MPPSSNKRHAPSSRRGGSSSSGQQQQGGGGGGGGGNWGPVEAEPVHSEEYLQHWWAQSGMKGQPRPAWIANPKAVISNYVTALGNAPTYEVKQCWVGADKQWKGFRASLMADPTPPPFHIYGPSLPPVSSPIVGVGDAPNRKDAEKLSALHACLQLGARGLFDKSNRPVYSAAELAARRSNGQVQTVRSVATQAQQPTRTAIPDDWGAAEDVGLKRPPASQHAAAPLPIVDETPQQNDGKKATLSNGTTIKLEDAREFMGYYCDTFKFGKADLLYSQDSTTSMPAMAKGRRGKKKGGTGQWNAVLLVQGRKIGMGRAQSKKDASNKAYLDTAVYLESVDPDLWRRWQEKTRIEKLTVGNAKGPHVIFQVDQRLDEELREVVYEARETSLYENARWVLDRDRTRAKKQVVADRNARPVNLAREEEMKRNRSDELMKKLKNYSIEDRLKDMRAQRESLPVTQAASTILAKINTNWVTILLAQTGSGKTTQVPQLILDDWTMKGKGGECKIICTQPRRIAAVSVATRVSAERGEQVGDTVGYHVRFESKPPKEKGSIMFSTTGYFLRRLQADLDKETTGGKGFLDDVTHICVDEVHERDVDTDLLLFVIRRVLSERVKQGKPQIRVILMSATVDPKLFISYFADPTTGKPAPTVDAPGRSFPVEKFWLDENVRDLQGRALRQHEGGWVWNDKDVQDYIQREMVGRIPIEERTGRPLADVDNLKMPYSLVSLFVASVVKDSEDGHVLVFLPGLDEIKAVQNILLDRARYPLFNIDFNSSAYELHVLHSTVPIAEQQKVFNPAPKGVRRIVLSTNIAETSVTIPDVVYVIDSGKCKEKRYDPERRLSQLVSAWTGTSNLLQRAGRAGRHRPGLYFSLVSKARFDVMDIHQTVEMLRTDLANTCMHITGLQINGLSVEDVLMSTIQPPERIRIQAAMTTLKTVGALDQDENLTSLGRVLLQLPTDVAIGKLCLLGSFFRCLDQAVTMAAILTNRDPFLSPITAKAEADAVKNSWAPKDFRSDHFAILSAWNAWYTLQSQGAYGEANRFASENFLSKPTLLLIEQIRAHLLQSLDRVGVLRVSGATSSLNSYGHRRGQVPVVPVELNVHGDSLPLLSALLAEALAPNFAVKTKPAVLMTSQDKSTQIHMSSVNSQKAVKTHSFDAPKTDGAKQIYAYAEKSKTVSAKGDGPLFLRGTTKIDPLGFMLFGASTLRVTNLGLVCDGWLPITGHVSALDDVERLKGILDFSLLRVFEGLAVSNRQDPRRGGGHGQGQGQGQRGGPSNGAYVPPQRQRDADEDDRDADFEEQDDETLLEHPALSETEVHELEDMAHSVVNILNMYAEGRGSTSITESTSSSRANSRLGGHSPYASQPVSRTSSQQGQSRRW